MLRGEGRIIGAWSYVGAIWNFCVTVIFEPRWQMAAVPQHSMGAIVVWICQTVPALQQTLTGSDMDGQLCTIKGYFSWSWKPRGVLVRVSPTRGSFGWFAMKAANNLFIVKMFLIAHKKGMTALQCGCAVVSNLHWFFTQIISEFYIVYSWSQV